MSDKLQGGDAFPELSLNTTDGRTLSIPGDLETPMTIALFYRGHW